MRKKKFMNLSFEAMTKVSKTNLDKRMQSFVIGGIWIARFICLGYSVEDAIKESKILNKNRNWIPTSERLPECEQEVLIQTDKGTRTTAMYEDGKMSEDDSTWNWNDIDYNYDESTDTRYIPEGWWEYKHFAPDDVYNYAVDEDVIAWQPLPEPYKEGK